MAAAAWRAISASGRRGRPSVEHHAHRAPAEPERDDLDATAMREAGAQLGQTGGVQLRSDRQRHLDPLGETVGSGNAQQVRAVDVDDVQRERNLGDALRLRHELVGEQGGSHDVEDVDPIEQHRALPSEPTGGQRLVGGLRGRGRPVLPDRLEQGVAVGEVPVERGPRHAGGRRDVRGRRRGRLLEQAAARLEDPVPCPLRARAPAGHVQQSTRSRVELQAQARTAAISSRVRAAPISEPCTGGARRRPGRSAARCP